MTLAEYVDPKRFPKTTQVGLSAKQQLQLDAYKLDALREMQEFGQTLDAEDEEIVAELKEKFKVWDSLQEELRSSHKDRTGPT